MEYKKFKIFAEKLVLNAGKIILKHQNKARVVKRKDLQDVATSADFASEKFIIESILRKYPDHSIYSEEKGNIDGKSDFRWIIDPLDGTKEFLRDIPLFNVSVALEYKGELIVSALFKPNENVLYSAEKGLGSFKNGKRIFVSAIRSLEKSFVYCYMPSFHRQTEKYDWAFKKLGEIGKKVYRLRSLANGNTALCWLAHGGFEAYINLTNPPKWHDIATGLLVAKSAGAVIKDINGNEILDGNTESFVVANNEFIYNEIVKIIR